MNNTIQQNTTSYLHYRHNQTERNQPSSPTLLTNPPHQLSSPLNLSTYPTYQDCQFFLCVFVHLVMMVYPYSSTKYGTTGLVYEEGTYYNQSILTSTNLRSTSGNNTDTISTVLTLYYHHLTFTVSHSHSLPLPPPPPLILPTHTHALCRNFICPTFEQLTLTRNGRDVTTTMAADGMEWTTETLDLFRYGGEYRVVVTVPVNAAPRAPPAAVPGTPSREHIPPPPPATTPGGGT